MRKFRALLFIALGAYAIGCGNSGDNKRHSWSETERNQYLRDCKNSGTALGEKAKAYCECSLEKLEEKFPDVEDVGKLTPEETDEISKACLK